MRWSVASRQIVNKPDRSELCERKDHEKESEWPPEMHPRTIVVKRSDFLAPLALVAAVALLYRKAARLWWTYDDPFHLHLSSKFNAAAMLVDRNFWQHLPNKVFTPFLFLSLKADQNAFGENAHAFYVHHLLSFAVLAILMYVLARL